MMASCLEHGTNRPEMLSLTLSTEEREHLDIVLMGAFDLVESVRRAAVDKEEIYFSTDELQQLEEVLETEIAHLSEPRLRRVLKRIRQRALSLLE